MKDQGWQGRIHWHELSNQIIVRSSHTELRAAHTSCLATFAATIDPRAIAAQHNPAKIALSGKFECTTDIKDDMATVLSVVSLELLNAGISGFLSVAVEAKERKT